MEVQFEWWSKWELNEKLKMPEHAGRCRRRWFSELVLSTMIGFTHKVESTHLDSAVEPRYTAKLEPVTPC